MRKGIKQRLDPYFNPRRFWGHMELFGETQTPVMATDLEGNSYVADTHGPVFLQLRCECGYAWEMLKEAFPGRRALQSCGRPQCRFTKRLKAKRRLPEQKGMTTTLYMSKDCIGWVIEQASEHGNSYSKEMEDIIRRAMADALINED